MMQPLEPCPFCKATNMRKGSRTVGHGESADEIICSCGASMIAYRGSVEEKWNTRPNKPTFIFHDNTGMTLEEDGYYHVRVHQ